MKLTKFYSSPRFVCRNCGWQPNIDEINDLEHIPGGWICPDCPGTTDCETWNYFDQDSAQYQGKFTLYVEDKTNHELQTIKPPRPLSQRLSLLRYPGGKSRLVNFVATQLRPDRCRRLVSPFAGGGSVELALLKAGYVDELILNDLDSALMALYETTLYHPVELIDRLKNVQVTPKLAQQAKLIITSGQFSGISRGDLAWYYLVNNRTSYSGIYNAGLLGGQNIDKLLARWRPRELIRRVREQTAMRNHITLLNQPAEQVIDQYAYGRSTTFYIDPPYIAKGPELYQYHFDDHAQHLQLIQQLQSLVNEGSGNDVLLFYDNDDWLKQLPVDVTKLARRYSIAN